MAKSANRDVRIDTIRGAALLMIFVDHMPRDWLGFVTLHNFSFSDAAEIFVLLAGVSSVLAYGAAWERDGAGAAIRRVVLRCVRIYAYQVGLFLLTLGVITVWDLNHQTHSAKLAPIFDAPAAGVFYGLTLRALPSYLDILPLYIVLLASFPLIYAVLRRSRVGALLVSGALWLFVGRHTGLDLPNWIDGKGWYFNPFAWQFLFTIGAVLSLVLRERPGGILPRRGWLTALSVAYLAVAFLETTNWSNYGLPNLTPVVIVPPDKSVLAWPRVLGILAITYLLFSSPRVRRWLEHRRLAYIAACGRHSLEIFSASCVLALFGRLAFRAYGDGLAVQVGVNSIGLTALFLLAQKLEWRRLERGRPGMGGLSRPGLAGR